MSVSENLASKILPQKTVGRREMIQFRREFLLPFLFLLLCGPLSVVLATNEPPGQVPDEHAHAVKAYSLLLGEFLGHREIVPLADGKIGPQQGVDADDGILAVSTAGSPAQLTTAHWTEVHNATWGNVHFQTVGTIAGYWPGFYVPAAVGFAVSKALGAAPFDAFLTARMFNLALYFTLGMSALLLTRRGQVLMFCTLSVPMSLHLGASVNQDGLIIATSVLAVALLSRSASGNLSSVSPPDVPRFVSAALLAAVVLAKPPYCPLAGLLLLPFPSLHMRRIWITRFSLFALILVCAVGWSWVTVRFVATPVVRLPAEAGPLWPGSRPAVFDGTDMRAQMHVLLAKPSRLLSLPLRTLMIDGIDFIKEGVGILGYLLIYLPGWLYKLWYWALGAAAISDLSYRSRNALTIPPWQSIFLLFCIVVSVLGIFLSQYLSWTDIGDIQIRGPQGRYFLPLIPAIAFAMPSFSRNLKLSLPLLVVPVIACSLDLVYLPSVIIQYFYMH